VSKSGDVAAHVEDIYCQRETGCVAWGVEEAAADRVVTLEVMKRTWRCDMRTCSVTPSCPRVTP